MSTVWPVCTVYIVLYSIFVFTVWFLSLRLSVVRSQGQDSWRSQSNSRLQGAKRQRPLNCRTGQEDWAGKTLRVCAFVIQPRRVFCVINLGQISLMSGGNTSKQGLYHLCLTARSSRWNWPRESGRCWRENSSWTRWPGSRSHSASRRRTADRTDSRWQRR